MSSLMLFLIAGLALVLFTGALLVWPLLRSGTEDNHDKPEVSQPGLAMVLLGLVAVSTIMIYVWIGTPQAIDRPLTPVDSLRTDLIALSRDLARNPDQPEAWFVLGMTYKEIRELSSAEHAFRRAIYIDEAYSAALTELAETLLLQAPDRRLPAEARGLLHEALNVDPGQQKALWLLGLSARQLGQTDEAVGYWTRLLGELERDSSVYALVLEQMQQLGIELPAELTATPSRSVPQPTAPSEPRLNVELTLDDRWLSQLRGDESVFVIVQAAGDTAVPTPLAVQRLAVTQLPAMLSFGDDDAMLPGLSMADFDRWLVTARVSMSGEVIPQAGDLQGQSNVLEASDSAQTIALRIDQRLSNN